MNLKNIAIIMDGNGRWAKKNNLQIKEGHARGVSALKEIVKESVNQNIESLTVYAFSTENWKRRTFIFKNFRYVVRSLCSEVRRRLLPNFCCCRLLLLFVVSC